MKTSIICLIMCISVFLCSQNINNESTLNSIHQENIFEPEEIIDLPNFAQKQAELDQKWNSLMELSVERTLSKKGFSLSDFESICEAISDDYYNRGHILSTLGLTDQQLLAIEKLYYVDERACGCQYLPKSAYVSQSMKWINACSECDIMIYSKGELARASSELEPQGKYNYSVDNLIDGDLMTAWVEGDKGYGIGEYVEYSDVYVFGLTGQNELMLQINNGYVKSQSSFENNSRVKSFKIYIDGDFFGYLNLQDVPHTQFFKIQIPEKYLTLQNTMKDEFEYMNLGNGFREMKLEIAEVYKGKKWADVAISRLDFGYSPGCCFIAGTQISIPDNRTKPIEQIVTGDTILTYNFNTGLIEKDIVKSCHSQIHNNLYELVFNDKEIIATDDHPFFVKTKGISSLHPQKSLQYNNISKIKLLQPGDSVYSLNDENMIEYKLLTSVKKFEGVHTTYTITGLNSGNSFFANACLVSVEELKIKSKRNINQLFPVQQLP